MIRSEKMILRKTDEVKQWLDEATVIYNQALYYLRFEYFAAQKEGRSSDFSKIDLYKTLKEMDVWKNTTLDVNAKQYVIRKVNDNWKSFYKACKSYQKDKSKFLGMPKIPNYLKNGRKAILIFDKTRLRHKDLKANTFCLPKSKYKIQLPNYIEISKIKCVIVKAYYGKVKLSISYEKKVTQEKLDDKKFMGIDIGVDNIVAITTDNQVNKSWIVKGGAVKSINQFYNKELAKAKSILETVNKQKTSKRIQHLNTKRTNKLEHEFHCISKKIVELCVANDIGNIVIGHNKNWKQECDLKKKARQMFVQIPFNSLIFKIQYKCEEAGINCIIVEESYTSKTDHLAGEKMCSSQTFHGRRVKRGLFCSSVNKILNADCNGAIGILRKANAFSDVDLVSLRDRGDVVSPMVLKYKP